MYLSWQEALEKHKGKWVIFSHPQEKYLNYKRVLS